MRGYVENELAQSRRVDVNMLGHEHAVSGGREEWFGTQQVNPRIALADDDSHRYIQLFRRRQIESCAKAHFRFSQQHGLAPRTVESVAQLRVCAFLKQLADPGVCSGIKQEKNAGCHAEVVAIERIGNETRYYTKGDANDDWDVGYRTDQDIVGLTDIKLAYVGYPTLWLRDLLRGSD